MKTTMSNSSRTKIITLAPYLSIVNELDDKISIAEWPVKDNKAWREIEPIKQNNKVK